MKLSDLDSNFKVESGLENRPGLKYLDAEQAPFKIYGVFRDGDHFARVPLSVAKTVSEGVTTLSQDTAGGRVRFRTDSPYVAIKCIYNNGRIVSAHIPATGEKGLDMYELYDGKYTYVNTFIPPVSEVEEYEASRDLLPGQMHEVIINMPLYHGVKKLYIGLDGNSSVYPPREYSNALPVVFYGSSITQGGCAARAGMSYQGMLSRWLDMDFINLGFSGNAKGEREIVDYFSDIKASVFVCDYDHNAPTPEHLIETLEPLYRVYREKNPDTPFVFISRPKWLLNQIEWRRHDHIKSVYEKVKAEGDANVYYIDGRTLTVPGLDDEGTVDHTHPTDLGFYFMAKGMYPLLKELLNK